jgi:MFS family permease
MNRNVIVLAAAQALGMSAPPMIILLGGLIGAELAPQPSWATLPLAVMVIGAALFSIPAALLMGKIGRRAGFMVGSCGAVLASLTAVYAIADHSFSLFCLSALGLGGNMAFVQQYRFAAAECVSPAHVGRAVSFVLIGGIFAAFLGPELAKNFQDWLPYGMYTGSFGALAGLYGLNILLLSFLQSPPIPARKNPVDNRPLPTLICQPLFLAAVFAGIVSYGVMSFIMTATPVSMHVIDDFSLAETAHVVQSHIVAMFVPSLFTGFLIERFGLTRIMIAGIVSMLICVGIALFNRHFIHYWSALVLLGIGWNFLFVGGTTLLTKSHQLHERFKVQAVNDFVIYGFQAAASLSAGVIIFRAGWEMVNIMVLPWLFFMLVVTLRIPRYLAQAEEL